MVIIFDLSPVYYTVDNCSEKVGEGNNMSLKDTGKFKGMLLRHKPETIIFPIYLASIKSGMDMIYIKQNLNSFIYV